MGNMFDNLGKGLNDFTKQAGKIAGNIGDTAGKITKDVAKGAGKIVNDAGKLAGDAGKMTAAVAGSVAQSAAVASGEVSKAADSMAKGTVSIAKNVKDSADKVDLFNSKLRAKAVEDYNNAVERYENVADDLAKSTQALYDLRKIAIVHVKYVEQHINQLANTPKEFAVELHKINTEVTTFENKEDEIKEAEKQAKAAEGGSGAGATLSALGIAVATMGPTAAMGVATTFGVASTGTAISALSGAAANSAALAWLGGGALAAGGGGMSAGTAFLGLAGPVGWTIAGVAGAAAIGSGIYANHKNKETADKLLLERQNVEVLIRAFRCLVWVSGSGGWWCWSGSLGVWIPRRCSPPPCNCLTRGGCRAWSSVTRRTADGNCISRSGSRRVRGSPARNRGAARPRVRCMTRGSACGGI